MLVNISVVYKKYMIVFTGNHQDETIDLQKSGGLTWKMWAEILWVGKPTPYQIKL